MSPARRRQVVVLGFLLIVLGVAGRLAWVHASAWVNFDRGRAALADDPAAARGYLDRCLETWPESGEVHFLAARAARRCGDLPAADRHLDAAVRCGWADSDIEVERALTRVQSGQLVGQEAVLLQGVRDGHPDAHLILAVLVPAYMAEYRWVEADALSNKWLELQPESATVWACRGEILERLRRLDGSIAAYRRVVELTPDDRPARLALARLILETRQPVAEAAEHLEWLAAADPKNPAVLVHLAACREVAGRPDEASALLDRVIAEPIPDPKAYFYRGRLEMNRGRPAAAVAFLRRGVELDPSDPEALYTLSLCLQQTGNPDEARVVEERWKRCAADLKRVRELGRAIAAAPHDPDLRREIGELFLRNGRDRDGLRWLESALDRRPDHAPTHRVLAAYYDQHGQPDRAEHHRRSAGSVPPVWPGR